MVSCPVMSSRSSQTCVGCRAGLLSSYVLKFPILIAKVFLSGFNMSFHYFLKLTLIKNILTVITLNLFALRVRHKEHVSVFNIGFFLFESVHMFNVWNLDNGHLNVLEWGCKYELPRGCTIFLFL